MAGLSFTVHTEGLNNLAELMKQRATRGEVIMAQQVKKDTEAFVPASQTMALNNHTVVVGKKIVYPGPYARFLYYGKVMVDPETGSPFARAGATKVLTDRDLVFSKTVVGHSQAQAFWFEASKAMNLEKWTRVAAEAIGNGNK